MPLDARQGCFKKSYIPFEAVEKLFRQPCFNAVLAVWKIKVFYCKLYFIKPIKNQ
jgi:hypothetical protein